MFQFYESIDENIDINKYFLKKIIQKDQINI